MKFSLPLYIWQSKKTKFWMNLNKFRNTHFRTLSKVKRDYHKVVSKIIGNQFTRFKNPVRIIYTVFFYDKRKRDISNIACIVDKFTCDALSDIGVLIDDNYHHVPEVVYRYGGIDKINPRAEVLIEEI